MPESLPIALALVALAVAGWDCARRYMQLAHGRMLSADRSQTFERAITQLETRIRGLVEDVATALATREYAVGLGNQLAEVERVAKAEIHGLNGRFDDVRHVLEQRRVALDEWREGLADWQKTCERSIELLQADIDKRDKAITNVAEEVAGLQRQQALALMGIAKTPKHGYAPGGPK